MKRTFTLATIALLMLNVNQLFGQWDNWCYKDYTYTGSSQTYTVPDACQEIYIEAIGAGGGGGNARATSFYGNTRSRVGTGGGGGGYTRKHISNPVVGSTYTITIGKGGTAATAGGNTTVTGTGCNIRANGGGAGSSSVATSTQTGAGGTSTGGDANYTGGRGGSSIQDNNNDARTGSGAGGGAAGGNAVGGEFDQPTATGYNAATAAGVGGGGTENGFGGSWLKGGNGGAALASWGNGNAGKDYGGGGSGARNDSRYTTSSGGSGANGIVRVWFRLVQPINVSITPSENTLCLGENQLMEPTYDNTLGTVTAEWSHSTETGSITIEPTTTTTYTFTVTDKYNDATNNCQVSKTAQCVITVLAPSVTLEDLTDKTIEIGSICNLEAVPTAHNGTVTYQWSPATYLDNTNSASVTATPNTPSTTEYTVTATATIDNCTATDSKTVTVTAEPTATTPVMTCPTITGTPTQLPAAYATYTEFINAGGTITCTGTLDESSFALLDETLVSHEGCNYRYSRTYFIKNTLNESTTCEQILDAVDATAPTLNTTIGWPADITDVDDCYSTSVVNSLLSDEEVKQRYEDDNETSVSHTDDVINSDHCGWKVTRTYTISDNCGNVVTPAPTMSISGKDQTAPTFTRPEDITLYKNATCEYDIDVSVTGDVTDEADNCSTALEATFTDADVTPTDACEGLSVIARTWSLVDDCGNQADNQVQTITIKDNIKPTFTAPKDTTLYKDSHCNDDVTPAVAGDVTDEADNCSTALEATYNDADVTPTDACEGTLVIERTWSLVDDCGNQADDQIQIITVKDSIKPTFTAPKDTTIYRDEQCIYDISETMTGDVTDEADNCTTTLEATYNDAIITPEDACEGLLIVQRTWSLVDDCGNQADDQIQIITVKDSIRPTYTRPADTTIYKDALCNYDASTQYTGMITDVWDNCSTILDTSYTDKDVTDRYLSCEGHLVIERTWKLVDNCGNISKSDSIQIIVVRDAIKPTFTAPKDTTIFKDEQCEYDITVDVVGDVTDEADNCTTTLEATFTDSIITPEDACEGLLIVQRTWSLIDDCENEADQQIQIITVKDTLAPTFVVPADLVMCRETETRKLVADTTLTGKPTDVHDNCSNVAITFTDLDTTGTDNEYRVITRVWEAKDACLNTTVDTQRITIVPAISEDNFHFACPTDSTIVLPYGVSDTLIILDTILYACDIVDAEVTLTNNFAAGSRLGIGDYPITWTATDSCGFTVSCSFNLSIQYALCETPITDSEGNEYKTIQIGSDCWMAENLRISNDGHAAPYHNDASNEENYGLLYSWYTALNIPEGDDNVLPTPDEKGAIRGICPEGWAIPTMDDFSKLIERAGGINKLKSPNTAYWLEGAEGDVEGNTAFEIRGSGYCDFTTGQFFNMKGYAGFWTCETTITEKEARVCKFNYFCYDAMPEVNNKYMGYSIRCIRKY